MTFVPDGIMADLRGLLNSSLVASATIPRSSTTAPCRVEPLTSTLSFSEFAGAVSVPEYNVQFANGFDIRAGDTPMVANVAEFIILAVTDAGTYSTATDTRAVEMVTNSDGTTMPIRQNAVVTLTSKAAGNPSIQASAVLGETNPHGTLGQYADQYPWTVMISPQLQYGDNTYPQQGDRITWRRRQGGAMKNATLSKSHPPHTLYLPVLVFMFGESD